MESRQNLWIVSIVAVVAIFAMVYLASPGHMGSTSSGWSEDTNLAGQAGKILVREAPSERRSYRSEGDACVPDYEENVLILTDRKGKRSTVPISYCNGNTVLKNKCSEEAYSTIESEYCQHGCSHGKCSPPPATCSDRIQNQGETGVDCGGPCRACPAPIRTPPVAICGNGNVEQGEFCDDGNRISGDGCDANCVRETCSDGIQNQGESGVDCGHVCDVACPSCSDGIRNQGETGTDCGGPCAACATCYDRIRNQGEVGVDCGGPCSARCCGNGIVDAGEECDDRNLNRFDSCHNCIRATCSDNSRNQGELGTDCGGPCQPCSCRNGIQDGSETGVDCGGSCQNACPVSCFDSDYGNHPLLNASVLISTATGQTIYHHDNCEFGSYMREYFCDPGNVTLMGYRFTDCRNVPGSSGACLEGPVNDRCA